MMDREVKQLIREDLLRLELAQERLKSASMQRGLLELTDKIEELSIHNLQLQMQVKAQELQIRRLGVEKELKNALRSQSEIGTNLESLKGELAEKYGVGDWNKVSYDDLTGVINELPEEDVHG